MRLFATGLFVCLAVLAVILFSPGVVHPTSGLTTEEAKAALVELLRRAPTAFERKLKWDDLAKQPVITRGPGRHSCGDFRISLPDAKYQITVTHGCVFEYEGTFQFRGKRWTASQPHWTSAGLIK
jgi:hypothetical protein